MVKHYLIIAFRNVMKYKVYSTINILGLALGMTCCLLILQYVSFELSYDNYHKDADRIYRIGIDIDTQSFKRSFAPISSFMAPMLKEVIPEVENTVRIWPQGRFLVNNKGNINYENNTYRADNEIFKIFYIPFLKGDPETALINPGTIVISEHMSKKYFGDENPVGKTLSINSNDLLVTGVVTNAPANTHFKYNFIASLVGSEIRNNVHWGTNCYHTYIKFRPKVDTKKILSRIKDEVDKRQKVRKRSEYKYFLHPIKEIDL